jgi:hypothetical protein
MRLAAIGPLPSEPEATLWADESGLAAVILALNSARAERWVADLSDPPGAGDWTPLRHLVIQSSSAGIEVGTSHSSMNITGSPDALMELAQFLTLYACYNDLSEPGMHTHVSPGDPPCTAAGTALMVATWPA